MKETRGKAKAMHPCDRKLFAIRRKYDRSVSMTDHGDVQQQLTKLSDPDRRGWDNGIARCLKTVDSEPLYISVMCRDTRNSFWTKNERNREI